METKEYTIFEICQTIQRTIMTRAAEVMNYTSWGSEFSANQIKNIPTVIKE